MLSSVRHEIHIWAPYTSIGDVAVVVVVVVTLTLRYNVVRGHRAGSNMITLEWKLKLNIRTQDNTQYVTETNRVPQTKIAR